jgi:hypothetical protein
MRPYRKEQAVNVTSSKGVPTCRLLKASQAIPLSLLTPAGVPVRTTGNGWHTPHLTFRIVESTEESD